MQKTNSPVTQWKPPSGMISGRPAIGFNATWRSLAEAFKYETVLLDSG